MDLKEISDRMEIQDLMVEYCYAVDSQNWDLLDEVFTPDAVIDYSEMVGFKGNLTETKAFLADGLKVMASTQHIISTTQLKFDGDKATGKTICTNPMRLAHNGHVLFVGLWYRDEFVRTPKGWRIKSRYEEMSWRYNFPEGLLPDEH